MQSYRHVCGRVADTNADRCADPNRPGTGDRAAYIFNRVLNVRPRCSMPHQQLILISKDRG